MGDASYVQPSFLGGEVSKLAQGRIDRPDYRTLMNVCLNGLPVETGAWVRRPGGKLMAVSRGGAPARTQGFDFKTSTPYTIEFSDGVLRFFTNTQLVMTNDQVAVSAISAANPAEVTTAANHGWATGSTAYFNSLGTVTAVHKFTLADAVTGSNIDGSTLGAFVSGKVTRVLEIVAPYTGGGWATVRVIKADIPVQQGTTPGAVLLHANIAPQVLKVVTAPAAGASATFTFGAAALKDGPYLDAFTNGVQVTPATKNGLVGLTLSFTAYDATRAYALGDYVTYSAVNYRSLTDANLNNQPDTHPSNWVAVSAGEAVNGASGFQGSDVGRHVRLYSEPPVWATGTNYNKGDVVAFAGTGLAFTGATYWQSLVAANSGNQPGLDLTKWSLVTGAAFAVWTWGKIVSLTNEISRSLAGSVNIGDMTAKGGLAAAFDGIFTQTRDTSAAKQFGTPGVFPFTGTGSAYVGKNYTGAAPQKIDTATVWPPDLGFVSGGEFLPTQGVASLVINLRAKASAPASSSDGTLLGSVTATSLLQPYTIQSNDNVTTWNYVWVELVVTVNGSWNILWLAVAELQLFNPPGSGTSSGATLQILGDPLLYTSAVRTWRLGLYSTTTGWPTCGTYHEGRLWLSGLVGNRIDASKSNDIFNFAPTQPDGTVTPASGISYTFNAPDVNTILWMDPDQTGIVCGTAKGEWLVQASALNQALTPTSIQAHRAMKHKCANIEPARTGLTLCAVQAGKRSLLEFFPDVYSGKFGADNMAEDAKHLTKGNIAELAFTAELTPVIWIRKEDGTLVGVTYRRKTLSSSQRAEIRGWHRHTLGSGRLVEYISPGPSVGGVLDALTMVTNDTASGVRHIEALNDILDEGSTLAQAAYLDDAVTPTAVAVSLVTPVPYGGVTLYGLWPLNGKTVTAWLGGLDCGDYLVTNGVITVPFGDGVSGGTAKGMFTAAFVATGVTGLGDVMFTGTMPALVGFSYNSDGQIVRPSLPAESGARNGPAFGKKRRNHQYAIQVEGTQGVSIGTTFATTRLKAALFKSDGGKAYRLSQQFSGIWWDTIVDDESFDGMICWRVSRPYIVNMAALGGFIHTEDK